MPLSTPNKNPIMLIFTLYIPLQAHYLNFFFIYKNGTGTISPFLGHIYPTGTL